MDAEKFAHTARSLGIILTPAQIEAFEQFEEALYEANKVVNLTRVPREECWLRHFIDSKPKDFSKLFSKSTIFGNYSSIPPLTVGCFCSVFLPEFFSPLHDCSLVGKGNLIF